MSCPIISEAEIWKDFLINSMYCRATRKILPPPQLFRQFYSYSFLVFLNAIASPQPMKGGQFSEWIPAGKGIISPPTSRDLYWVSLTRLSWQPSFVIVLQLGASFRELPALSSGSHPQFLCAGRKSFLLQRTSTGATTAEVDPSSLRGRAMPQPGLELQKDLVSKVQPTVLTGYLCSLWSKAKQDSKQGLDYVRERHALFVLSK